MTIPDDSNSVTELGQNIGILARLVEVSLALNSTLDPDELLQSIIDAAAELLDCQAASLMLYDIKNVSCASGRPQAQIRQNWLKSPCRWRAAWRVPFFVKTGALADQKCARRPSPLWRFGPGAGSRL